MDNIELDDLVYTYPAYNQENVQTLITAKEEFRQLAGEQMESVPKRGQLYRHQKFIKRLMTQYDNQLLAHLPGVGKSCAVISVTEQYKAIAGALEEIRKNTEDPNTLKTLRAPYKRAYVLVKGQNLIDEFKHQILCKCTDGDYITDQILNSKTETARKSNVTRSISRFYTITTYGTFAKTLFELTDEQLRIEFDNSIFIVDEVHNINDDKTGGILRKNAFGNSYYVHIQKGEEKIIESRLIYDQFWRLFHVVKPRKVMLLSATPMINDASELASRLNLILPEDNQIPENINWLTVSLNTLEPYFRGLISYVRALDTGAIPVYQGKVLQAEYQITENEKAPAQFVVYGTEMAEKQLTVYRQAVNDPMSLRPDSQKPEAFDDLKRQAANFVFPDDSTGSIGFDKYVMEDKKDYQPTPEFRRWLASPEHFRSLSAKFFEIVRLCRDEPGNCWCYLNYIKGAGAIVLGFCFNANGFERFNEPSSVFSTSGGGVPSSVCGGKSLDDADLNRERFIRIPKKLRYALLTSDTSGPESSALLELFNSYENRHGEYIKAIIGSPVTRDGLNLANVLQIHLAGPGWNQASSYQAESRAIRSTSHVDLLEEEKTRLVRAGLDPETAYITIKVYRHAALTPDGNSVDIDMYEMSEKKDREIKRVMRMMKQCSTDCQINYNRNVRPKDIDYSATCDYDICAYKCVSPAPNFVDYTSFDVLYSEDIIESVKSEIIDIFRIVFQITYEDLYKELEGYRRKFVDLAVTEMVEKKISIFNRYGYRSYIREDRGTLFLRNDFPLNIFEPKGAVSLSDYSSYLIGKETITLNEYNGTLQRGSGNILDILEGLNTDEIYEKIDSLTLENRILLLEKAIEEYYVNKNETKINRTVLTKFRSYIYIQYEPRNSIKYVEKAISERGKGRGRKPKEGSKFKLTDKQEKELGALLEKEKGEVIFFHNLYTSSQAQTSYSITAKFKKSEGKIRLLKPSEKISWRDTNEVEELVYNEMIRNKTQKEKVEHQIYGLILGDEKFRIVDKSTEDPTKAKDQRTANRGRVCTSWKHLDLVNLLWKIGFNPFDIEVEFNRNQLIAYLKQQQIPDVEEFTDEKLKFFYVWYTSAANKNRICQLLQEYFEENGLLVKSD